MTGRCVSECSRNLIRAKAAITAVIETAVRVSCRLPNSTNSSRSKAAGTNVAFEPWIIVKQAGNVLSVLGCVSLSLSIRRHRRDNVLLTPRAGPTRAQVHERLSDVVVQAAASRPPSSVGQRGDAKARWKGILVRFHGTTAGTPRKPLRLTVHKFAHRICERVFPGRCELCLVRGQAL